MTVTEAEIREIVNKILKNAEGWDDRKELPPIPVETSARHVHLTAEAAKALFGSGTLTEKRKLSQPGEFLAQERVKLVTAKGELTNVAVLGPERSHVQVELSATDCKTLGIDAPVNLSGKLSGAGDVLIIGPAGIVKADEAVIIAKAHIHMTPADAATYGVKNGQTAAVRINSRRPITLEDVIVRVSDSFALAMHIDFDEANAALADKSTTGTILLECRERACASEKAESPDCTNAVRITGKKLITEADARMIAPDCGEVHIPAGVIITPAAKDVFTSRHSRIVTD